MAKFTMSIPNLKVKNGRYYFRKVIPADLRQHYNNNVEIIKSLSTTDLAKASQLVKGHSEKYRKEFAFYRSGGGLNDPAIKLLKQHRLKPIPLKYQPEAIEPTSFGREFDIDDSAYTQFFDTTTDGYDYHDALEPVDQRAFDILNGKVPILLSEAREQALKGIKDRKVVSTITSSFDLVSSITDVNNVSQINPFVLQTFIDEQQKLSPETVKRYFNKVSNAIENLCRLYGKQINNPFKLVNYKKRKPTENKRKTPTPDEYRQLVNLCKARADVESVKLIGLLLNTGLRVAEAAGLEVEDVVFDAEIPYLIIKPTQQRSVKTASSERIVPLFGISLDFAKTLVKADSKYLFPHYNRRTTTSNDAASAAVNKYIKANLPNTSITSHSFRHLTNTRLGEAGISEEIRRKWHGWSSQDMVVHYGNLNTLPLFKSAVEKLQAHELTERARYKT